MAILVRDQNKVLWQFESGTYAIASGTSGNWFGLVTEHTPSENENQIEIRYAGTANRNFGQIVQGPSDYEGTLTYHPQSWAMFALALGSNVDGGSPSPYTHTISELNSDNVWAFTSGTLTRFPSMTVVDIKKGNNDGHHFIRKYPGAVVDSITLTASNGEALTCEVSYKAQSNWLGSKTTDLVNTLDEDTSRPFLWSDVKFHLPSGTIMTEVNEVALTIENSLENRHYVNGSRVAQAMVPTMRNYTVDLTMDANSIWGPVLHSYNRSGTSFNCMLEVNASAGSEDAFFIMSGCQVIEFEGGAEVEGIDEMTATIKPQSMVINVNDLIQKYNLF